ncbi:hypothetical protein EJB05_16139, partial [Eragrostis curvula]
MDSVASQIKHPYKMVTRQLPLNLDNYFSMQCSRYRTIDLTPEKCNRLEATKTGEQHARAGSTIYTWWDLQTN